MNSEPLRLTGSNFQAWDTIDLEVSGFTAIVGPTDLGKSALIRALMGLLRNDVGANRIRLGESGLELTLTQGEHTIAAKRTKKSVTYVVDGVDYAKLGGAVPQPLIDMGFGEIEIGDVTIDPMFSKQSDGQFLIDDRQSPQALNTILGGFASTERLDSGKKQGKLNISEKDSEAKSLAVDIQAEEELKGKLEPLVDQAKGTQDSLQLHHEMYIHAQSSLATATQLRGSKKRLAAVSRTLSKIPSPDFSVVESSLSIITGSVHLRSSLKAHERVGAALQGVPNVNTGQAESQYLTALYAGRARKASLRLQGVRGALNKLKGSEGSLDTAVASYRIMHLAGVIKATHTAKGKARSETLHATAYSSELLDNANRMAQVLLTLRILINAKKLLSVSSASLANATEELSQAQAKVQAVVNDYQEHQRITAVEAAKIHCPKCGESIPHGEHK